MRNLLSGAENFVNGGLVALGVRLDMDLVLKATVQMKTPAFLLCGFEDISGRALRRVDGTNLYVDENQWVYSTSPNGGN
ncbi:hypothetical protein LU631_19340 [Erwinia tracheiphila]|uniref:hypothetical protein n=1 Tax=Erwinia tracheiphila TaxID=65700 RepID=UPI00033EF303|nr:hypothetical protein [Erwinia tracheiphila]EOS96141.1 hypothetical protein ETR_04529 [Erwinia tracheiphila PSU-1]UIA86952.1 hypothetical protein LU631_19340 [Erwinia tracheiphila]UIA95308.1 hypothetical protein LU633_17795 [Erwinia tracheiphila]